MDNGYLNQFVEAIHSKTSLLARGGNTKTGIINPPKVETLDLSSLTGIREYTPSEYTFTALAGTPLKVINHMLAENGQFLPFDPPLMNQGATLGGTVASNLNGPGRYHYGGVRDFILGAKFLDDQGRLIRSGGKVVKNAAGFDIPKLMVGSLGSLGTLVELSFKVFPKPKEFITVFAKIEDLSDALNVLLQLTSSPVEILCLEIEPVEDYYNIEVRLGGEPTLFEGRISHLGDLLAYIETIDGETETKFWETINEFNWVPEDTVLVKIPLIPKQVPALEEFLKHNRVSRRYSAGANLAWVAWSKPISSLDEKLKELDLTGLTILGSTDQVRIGNWEPSVFYQKIKKALDPSGLWAEV
jgi:glycolate oxidase FAD binding subunit